MIKRLTLPLLLVALAAVGCSSFQESVNLRPGYGIAEQGTIRIGDSLDVQLLAALTLDYVNLYRAHYDLPRLNLEQRAVWAAQWMASYQATRSTVTHVASDVPSMRIFPLRYRACGGDSYARGVENAGWYRLFETDSSRNLTYDEMARRIVDGWINSPGHHKNLIARAGDAEGLVGIGIARGTYTGLEGIYSTLNVFFPWPDHALLDPQEAPNVGG
jgi:uncharacterized protein YkwD